MGCNMVVGVNLFAHGSEIDRINLPLCGIATGRINSPLHVFTGNGKQALVDSATQIACNFDCFQAFIMKVGANSFAPRPIGALGI